MSKVCFNEKRPRKNFGEVKSYELSNLLSIQTDSYRNFVDIVTDKKKYQLGIHRILSNFFPIESSSGNVKVEYLDFEIFSNIYSVDECKSKSLTYSADLKGKLKLIIYDKDLSTENNKIIKEEIEEWVYMGSIPLMTPTGSFVVNGIERVVVSQLHRSPGIFFDYDKNKSIGSKILYQALIIPYRGSWIDLEFDIKNILFFRIDRRKKLPITVLLKAFGMTKQDIIDEFFDSSDIQLLKSKQDNDDIIAKVSMPAEKLLGSFLTFDIKNKQGDIIVDKGQLVTKNIIEKLQKHKITKFEVDKGFLLTKYLSSDLFDQETGEIIAYANDVITDEVLLFCKKTGIRKLSIIHATESEGNHFMSKTLSFDIVESQEEAISEIYKILRPGDLVKKESAQKLFENLFYNEDRYSLSDVGRMKLNSCLGRKEIKGSNLLSLEDVIAVIKKLVDISIGKDSVDDIDSLSNRRVRTVEEMVENKLRVGLIRVEKVIRDSLNSAESNKSKPHNFISAKPITAILKNFFATGQMSQFMEQTNPLAEITHKRKITALGPGGLSRDRSGFEVRDVHATHYGRLCPIETPEGANIGLINALAVYARLDEYGLLTTPYYKVVNKKVSNKIVYCSVMNEKGLFIAQASTKLDSDGKIADDLVRVRIDGEVKIIKSTEVDMLEVSPKQAVSLAASLIPFIEHDDANRALMGSNMQRQAVPILGREKPLVGTGIEELVAKESGSALVAVNDGEVVEIESTRIVVKINHINKKEIVNSGVDIYNLIKYKKSNQNTCINQVPAVKVGDQIKKGDVLTDSFSIDGGDLALGANVRVAFMSWNGYNFEDSIVLSERLARNDVFTSIHIESFVCHARANKNGDEEITADIPNISEELKNKLDDDGIIYIGSQVKPEDILVGKIIPKKEIQHTPEERLLHAIFGEKATEVKDNSLRVPSGVRGVVIDVQVYSRNKGNKLGRAIEIEEQNLINLEKDYKDQLATLSWAYENIALILENKTLAKSIFGYKIDTKLTKKILANFTKDNLLEISIKEKNTKLIDYQTEIISFKEKLRIEYDNKKQVITEATDMNPGILHTVKVYVSMKKRINVGDKMAGRHGNKGVISAVIPVEDMPFDENGKPVDLILNPLGVPSRMNIGQIMEVHLGWAALELGHKIEKMLVEKEKIENIKNFLKKIYGKQLENKLDKYSDQSILEISKNLARGLPTANPVFDGAKESEIIKMIKLADLNETCKIDLYDGLTGDKFDNKVNVGCMYILKLNHLVDDKMHARATGPYSLVTQQPLGGKAQSGGQRFGEMEVWALEAYGAAYMLQEMLTVKSDDIEGRSKMYDSLIRGESYSINGVPESFNVLIKEIRALGLDIDVE